MLILLASTLGLEHHCVSASPSNAVMTPDEQEVAFLSMLDACDDYLYAQNQLASSLKEGYLLLAKARYSMGHHQVRFPRRADDMLCCV